MADNINEQERELTVLEVDAPGGSDGADNATAETAVRDANQNAVMEKPAAGPPAPKKLNKPKKRRFYQKPVFYVLITVAVVVVILCVIVINNMQAAMQAAASPAGNTAVVERRSLRSDILTSGTVNSKYVDKVYAPSALKVKAILKDVGDTVAAGEPLATLDTYQLEMDIKQTELNIQNLENGLSSEELSLSSNTKSASSSVETARIQVEQAQRDYDKLLTLEGGSTVRNAEIALEDARRAYNDALNPASTVQGAQIDLNTARSKYDGSVRDLNDARDAMNNAESQMNSAQSSIPAQTDPRYADAVAAYEKAATSYNTAKSTYDKLYNAMPDAQLAYDKARLNYENTQKNIGDTLVAKQDALEKAQLAYDDAVRNASENLKLAEEKLKNAQLSYRNASDNLKVAKSKDSVSTMTNIELQRLNLESKQKQLREAELVAPSGGVVTYANISEGATASGLMYVIENVESLIVVTTVGEYDIDSVALGQKVIIKTDFTGNDEFIGEVSYISPTAQKSASGDTTTTNSVKFDIEITITQFDPRLKVGMNTTTSVITNERADALAVPFDAVYERDGLKYVLVIDEAGGTREIQVETGIETDAFTEVISGELREGMRVVLNADDMGSMTPGIQFGIGGGGQ